MTAQAEAGVWLVSECPIENGTLLKTERVVSLHATADEALSEVRRQGKIMRDNDLRGFLYGYKFYPVPGLLAQQPAPASTLPEALEGLIRQWDGEYVAAAPNEQEVWFLREHADALREALRAAGHPVSTLQRDLDDALLAKSNLFYRTHWNKGDPRWLSGEWPAAIEAADREVERARAALSAAEAQP